MHDYSSRGQPPPRKHGRPSEPPTEQGNDVGNMKKKAKHRHDRTIDRADVVVNEFSTEFSTEQSVAQAEAGGSRLRYDINARFNFSGGYPPDSLDHDDQGFRIRGAAQNARPARPVFPDRNLGHRPLGNDFMRFEQRMEGPPPSGAGERVSGLQELLDRDRRERHMVSPTRSRTPNHRHQLGNNAYHGYSGGETLNHRRYDRSQRHTTTTPSQESPNESFDPRTPARSQRWSPERHSQSSPLQNNQTQGRSARRNKQRRRRRRRTAANSGDKAEDSTPTSTHNHERSDVPDNGNEENDEQSQESLPREPATPKPQKRKKRSSAPGHSAVPSQHPRDRLQRIRPDNTYVVTHSTGGDNRHKMWYYCCTDQEQDERYAVIQAIDDNAPISTVLYTSQLIPANRMPRNCPPHPWDLSSPLLQALRRVWRRADWNRAEVFKYIDIAADHRYPGEDGFATITDSDINWAYDKMGKDYAVLEAGL